MATPMVLTCGNTKEERDQTTVIRCVVFFVHFLSGERY